MQSRISKLVSGKAGEIYRKLAASTVYRNPAKFIQTLYMTYQASYGRDPNINGRIFEYLVCETLIQQGVSPFYYQAKFERVPNVIFDIVLYDALRPVVLTTKTSLRERYKQADLEGTALLQVYRQAEVYLITMSSDESSNVINKIDDGSVTGITSCVLATDDAYIELLSKMKNRSFSEAIPIIPITGKYLID